MRRTSLVILSLVLLAQVLLLQAPVAVQQAPAAGTPSCVTATRESGLPLPSSITPEQLADYEKRVLAFLRAGTYKTDMGWCGDKGVRDTGPFIAEASYGTHNAVRVYYSPLVMKWLIGGHTGTIPDGAMIIKEQWAPPAERHAGGAPRRPTGPSRSRTRRIERRLVLGRVLFNPTTLKPMPFDDHAYPYAIRPPASGSTARGATRRPRRS